ncbi:MAG: hybrid sensor histidine kinase/response regulator [Chloroflexi bacterium]|nr:hybrid sensor histidine kinase/response regulator [Chloroflexota bacterium]
MTKILVIDDETMLRDEIVEWLTLEGYETLSAENGMEGLNLAFRYLPDLIACDITMPQLNGYEVLQEIRANQTTTHIPFIFLTARAGYEDIRQGMTSGADDYITKPFTRLELLQTIQARLDKQATQLVSYQRQVDQLQHALIQADEQRLLKAKMVAIFSHDFRNPITTILWSNNILRHYEDRLDKERRLANINRIEAAAQQLMQMLDDLLFISQMESGNLDFKPESLSIGDFLAKIIDEFQAIHSETHHLLFEDRFSGEITLDPRLLRQIAANLISNAIKYSLPVTEIYITLDNHEGQECLLTVQDQGIGIAENDQMHLFEVFKRGSNVGDIGGTGLGLAIVKQAVDFLGGSIRLESQIGVGTKVTVTMPL